MRTPRDRVARSTAFVRFAYHGRCDSSRRIPLCALLTTESRGADILDISNFTHLEVGGAILFRIGEDLYMRDGRNVAKLGEVAKSKIQSHCALYSKKVEGFLRHVGRLGCISRTGADILKYINLAYRRHKKYGDIADRDGKSGSDILLRDKLHMTYMKNAYLDAKWVNYRLYPNA